MFIRNFLSAILITPPEIPQNSGRWEEAYIAFLQDFCITFCFSDFVARASTSYHCIRRMSKEEPEGNENIMLVILVLRTDTLEWVEL